MPLFSAGSISDLIRRLMDVKSRRLGLPGPLHPKSGSAVARLSGPQLIPKKCSSAGSEGKWSLGGHKTRHKGDVTGPVFLSSEVLKVGFAFGIETLTLETSGHKQSCVYWTWCVVTQALVLSQQQDLFIKSLLNSWLSTGYTIFFIIVSF